MLCFSPHVHQHHHHQQQQRARHHIAQLARARRVLSLAVDVVRAAGPRVRLWSAEDMQQLAQVAQHVRRVQEAGGGDDGDEQGRGGEKQRHLQGVCLRLIRDVSSGQRQGACKAD